LDVKESQGGVEVTRTGLLDMNGDGLLDFVDAQVRLFNAPDRCLHSGKPCAQPVAHLSGISRDLFAAHADVAHGRRHLLGGSGDAAATIAHLGDGRHKTKHL
jgi:hypothetical protein